MTSEVRDPLAGPQPGDPWFPFSEASLGDRGKRFYAVKEALRGLMGAEWSVVQRQNDAMEWTIEIGRGNPTEIDLMLVWIVGMMDEPVWGYDLEAESSTDRSWGWVKAASLELPEMSEPNVVAQALREAVLRDEVELKAAEGTTP